MSGAESVEDTLYLVRERVLLVTLNVLAVAMPLVCVVFAWQAYQGGSLNPPTTNSCACSHFIFSQCGERRCS